MLYIIIHCHFEDLTIVVTEGEELTVGFGGLRRTRRGGADDEEVEVLGFVAKYGGGIKRSHVVAGVLANAGDVGFGEFGSR